MTLRRRVTPAPFASFASFAARAGSAAILLATARPAPAQIDSALLSKVSYNLANPGGKSLAMGGAFTAIADDATAALANPAGLGLLSTVEAGISFKRTDSVIGLVTARSTATGALTDPYPDPRGVNSDLGGTLSGVEYAGVVIPVSRRLVAAVSYSVNLAFHGDPGADGYAYLEMRDNRSGGSTRRDFLFEYREHGAVSLESRVYGVSAAYRVTDRLRLGAGVSVSRMTFDLEGDAGGSHRIVNTNYLTPTLIETKTITLGVRDFGGTPLGFVVGVHADLLPDGTLTAGAVYRQSGRHKGTLVLGGDVPDALQGQEQREFSLRVPRDAALGLAWQPFPGLTLAAEGQWIAYSDFVDRQLPVVSYSGLVGPAGFPVDGALATLKPPSDAVIPRVGVEYASTTRSLLLAFRLGYRREPRQGVTGDLAVLDGSGTPYEMTDPPYSAGVRTVYDGGKPDDHFTGGIGATLNGRFSFDFAFDAGRSSRLFSASLFYRF